MWVKRYAKNNDFSNSRQINIGAYTIDTESHILRYCGNNEKTLSNTEFATFKLLWINKGNVVSRQEFKILYGKAFSVLMKISTMLFTI